MDGLRLLGGHDDLKPLLDASDKAILDRLGTTTLVCVPGTDGGGRARLVSCLLHGNEDSGFRAVAALLRSGARFPYDLWVLVGNVEAARVGGRFAHRYLDGQEDFNRVWGADPVTPQRRVAADVLAILRGEPLEAALDLHNTTGRNPPHAIVPAGSPGGAAVAAVCADLVLRWRLGAHTLMEELTAHCPAIAVECGIVGAPESAAFADGALARFLSAGSFAPAASAAAVPTFEMRERVVVRPEVSFAFGPLADGLGLAIEPGLDACNFRQLPAGTRLGEVRGDRVPLAALDMDGRDVTASFFAVRADGALVLTRDVVPAMMTREVEQTRRDCFFYIVRRC